MAVEQLTISSEEAETHQTAVISGFSDTTEMRTAISRYLVGLRVNAINAGLAVRATLADTDEDKIEVVQNVEQIIGAARGALNEDQVTKERNPWLAEGIWHLCVAAAQQRPELHPPGAVLAVNLPHPKAKNQGMDVAVIFSQGQTFGLSIIESKAYTEDVSGALQSSLGYFKRIDAGDHSLALRQLVSVMRGQIPSIDQSKISETLWKTLRCYMPNPHFEAEHALQWTTPRPAFGKLIPGPKNIFIMPHGIIGCLEFFECVAEGMREAASEV